jgi:hypothetical protein
VSSPPTADASDAVVEMLPEQSSPRRAEEFVKELSPESRKIEASVRAPGGGGAAWKDSVLGTLHDGHAHACAAPGSRGGDGAGASSLAFVWKRELNASLLVTIVALFFVVDRSWRTGEREEEVAVCL